MKKKSIIKIILWGLIVFFSYKIYDSINTPIHFNKIKNERYARIIKNLKTIQKTQIAHKDIRGYFASNFDSLIKFVENDEFILIEERDSSYLEYNEIYRIDMLNEIVIRDTLGFVSVKDSLFKNSDEYKYMRYVPIEGIKAEFKIKSNIILKQGYRVPVFEVKIAKDIILHDQNKYLLEQEKKLISVDGVNGPELILGSLTNVSTNGNWPSTFDAVQ